MDERLEELARRRDEARQVGLGVVHVDGLHRNPLNLVR